jgi:hypothetical protein
MRISERRLRCMIREIIIESGEVDPWVKIQRDNINKANRNIESQYTVDDDETVLGVGLYDYAIRVLDRCSSLDYTRTFVDDDSMFLKEPIQIGKSYRDLVDIRDVLNNCFKNSMSIRDCADDCILKWKNINNIN